MKPITPETYEAMNREFIEKGENFRINVPTQEAIDEWRNRPPFCIYDYLDEYGQARPQQQATDASTTD